MRAHLTEKQLDTDGQDLRINNPQILPIRVQLLEGQAVNAIDQAAAKSDWLVMLYQNADSGNEREATMYFDGALEFKSIFGFSAANGAGAPREFTPQQGDQFTIYEEWVETDDDGNEVNNQYLGDTLTFSGQPFTVTAYAAYPGEYSVAITVEDLNGNTMSEYANVPVTE